jgi:isopropylmalate/homocitrate/citramalate synthase
MVRTSANIQLNKRDREAIAGMTRRLDAKMSRLRSVVPHVLDLSALEGRLPAPCGHTLKDRIELYKLAEEFGFDELALFSFFDFYNVDVQFLEWYVKKKKSMDGVFATISTMGMKDGGAKLGASFRMNYSIDRTLWGKVPNVVVYLDTRPSLLKEEGRTGDGLLRIIEDTVMFLREHLPAENAKRRRGRIYLRLADVFDAWDEDPVFFVRMLKLFAALPISGIMFEDVRGTHFPFQTAELVKLMRRYNPAPRVILLHPHSGNGTEDADVIEGLLAGADGIWAGFTPHAAQGYHASSLMLLTNLLRAGNKHVRKSYKFERLTEIADRMVRIHMGEAVTPDYPVIGKRAYRYIDPGFVQIEGRECDLPPEWIGCTEGYHVTPSWAPPWVIGKRLEELGYPPEVFENRDLLRAIRLKMSDSCVAGKHIEFDKPKRFAKLVKTCSAELLQAAE